MPLFSILSSRTVKLYQNRKQGEYRAYYGFYQEFYFLSVKESFLTVSKIACFCSGESAAK